MEHKGLIETNTGNLLVAGYVDFTPSAGETLVTNVPIPAKVKGNPDFATYHNWNGSSWDELTNSTNTILSEATQTLEITVADRNFPYVDTASKTYATVSYFVFRGSIQLGTPTSIKVIVSSTKVITNRECSIRLFDVTNGNIIAETTFDNDSFEIIDMGLISNIPTNEAIFEVQCMANNGLKAQFAGLSMRW